MIYFDDIFIFKNNKKKHQELVLKVLQQLENNNLFTKAEKCFFKQNKIAYFNMIILKNHVKMNSFKVSGVLNWSTFKKVKNVQTFLEFANFYRQFIKKLCKNY